MKVSVSLPDEDVAFLDAYVESQGIESRSAALHKAVKLLRTNQLADDYEDAFRSWADEDEAAAWESVTGDGQDT
jgi:Arc/MetJ-type ribon-helix-helix transcriptional regulator